MTKVPSTYLARPIPKLRVFSSNTDLSKTLGTWVRDLSTQCAPQPFVVALSGGSLPNLLWEGLAHFQHEIDWNRWHIIFADERCVPHTSPDSNAAACSSLLAHVPNHQIYKIREDLVDDPLAAAEAYDQIVRSVLQGRPLNLALLGMGPDGHTCSLFPHHPIHLPSVTGEGLVAAVYDSPKPPATRITLTLQAISATSKVAFVCTGASKRTALKQIFLQGEASNLPAAFVHPCLPGSELHWFVDEEAVSDLSPEERTKWILS